MKRPSKPTCWKITIDQCAIVVEDHHESFDLLFSRINLGHDDVLEKVSLAEGGCIEVLDSVASDFG